MENKYITVMFPYPSVSVLHLYRHPKLAEYRDIREEIIRNIYASNKKENRF